MNKAYDLKIYLNQRCTGIFQEIYFNVNCLHKYIIIIFLNLQSGPCTATAPHPIAVHMLPEGGMFGSGGGKHIGSTQRLNLSSEDSLSKAISFFIYILKIHPNLLSNFQLKKDVYKMLQNHF